MTSPPASFCSVDKKSQKDAPPCFSSGCLSYNSFYHILISRSGLWSSEGSLVLIMDAEGPWLTPKGETAGDRAAKGDSEGEKLGDIAADEMDPSWLIGDLRSEARWGNVRPRTGTLGGTDMAPGWATDVMSGGGSILGFGSILCLGWKGWRGFWLCWAVSSFSLAISVKTLARGWNWGHQLSK